MLGEVEPRADKSLAWTLDPQEAIERVQTRWGLLRCGEQDGNGSSESSYEPKTSTRYTFSVPARKSFKGQGYVTHMLDDD